MSPTPARHRKPVTKEEDSAEGIADEPPFPETAFGESAQSTVPTISVGNTPQNMPPSGRHAKPDSVIAELDKTRDVTKPKAGPPNVDEWQDFIGRVVLRTSLEAYMGWVLKDIDLSAEELASIALTTQDLKEMSTPIAVFTSKNSWAKKHGREIISATDSIESVISISIWMRRVHRIARKHRPEKQAARKPRTNPAMRAASQSQSQVQQPVVQPAARLQGDELARMAGAYIDQQNPSPLYERATTNGHLGSAEAEGPRKPQPPNLGQFGGNPGTG